MGNKNTSELSEQSVAELSQNSGYSASEIHKLYADFKRDFPDDVITRQSFRHLYRRLFPDGDVTNFADYVFNAYDVDGNGLIDFDEFVKTLGVAANGTAEEKLKWAFKLYDLNGDGHVTPEEATEMILAIYRLHGKNCSRIDAESCATNLFQVVDRNRDDSLSESEFISAIQRSPVMAKLLATGT